MTRQDAEFIGVKALGWIAGEEELFLQFVNMSGASQAEMRAQAAQPEFLGAVLDFVMMDDARVMAFCDAHALSYDQPMAARSALPGGDLVHWT